MTNYATLRRAELESLSATSLKTWLPAPSEHEEQVAVIDWWAYACKGFGIPEKLLFAIPNAGKRSWAVGRMMKAEGLRQGCPDLMLAAARGPWFGLFIEMKALKQRARPEQREFQAMLEKAGYKAVTCQGAPAAIAEITTYLNGGLAPLGAS